MTTLNDRGGTAIQRVSCCVHPGRGYLPIELALRDMRAANGRNPDTGEGVGNASWIGASVGMIVLDSLSGEARGASTRFKNLLVEHSIDPDDASLLWMIRNSLLHGYGLPKLAETGGRRVAFIDAAGGYALDTRDPDEIRLSIPVFCAQLVERIAAAVPDRWDTSLIDVDGVQVHIGVRYLPPMPPIYYSTP